MCDPVLALFRPPSRHAHHLAGQAGQASRAKIQAQRDAGKEARTAAKGKAVAEQEQDHLVRPQPDYRRPQHHPYRHRYPSPL